MALGYTTYKTPYPIYLIGQDLSEREGCGVVLEVQGGVSLTQDPALPPYAIVTVGGPSQDNEYPGLIGKSSVEFVDQLGCVVQVRISNTASVAVNDFLIIDANSLVMGTFTSIAAQPPEIGHWIWGYALTAAEPNEQCIMRFQTQFYFGTFLGP